jgi:group I intron endonuclease
MEIYLYTNSINGKPYVGKTEVTSVQRWKGHLGDVRSGSQRYFHRAIRKYGEDAFARQILERDVPTIERLNELETAWIYLMDSKAPHGYNMSDGGEGQSGFHFSKASRQKMSASSKGRKFSAEHKRKIGDQSRGRVVSSKTRKKLSRKIKAKWQEDEQYRSRSLTWLKSDRHRELVSQSGKGRVYPPEFGEKISARMKGKMAGSLNPFYGKQHSPESIQKMSEAKQGSTASEETRAKMRIASKKRWEDPEERKKFGDKIRGKHHSLETRAKIKASLNSPEVQARLSAVHSNPSEELRYKFGSGRRGKPHKPETIAKMKAAWALRKQRQLA